MVVVVCGSGVSVGGRSGGGMVSMEMVMVLVVLAAGVGGANWVIGENYR